MVSQEYVEEVLASGHELRSFEVKGCGEITDEAYVAKIARAAMAMGNLRDGGQVCLGIGSTQLAAMLPGLTANQLRQWTNYDNVSDQLAMYSDPPVTFRIQEFNLSSGAHIVILDVEEFDTELHICKRDFPDELQAGQTYVRPRGKPRTAQVPSLAEMRELHTLAIDKGVREFVRRLGVVGLPLTGDPAASPVDIDAAAFNAEIALGWREPSSVDAPKPGSLLDGIGTPAFTDVTLQPGPYKQDRLRPDELPGFVAEHAVRLRGWPVPMISNRDPIARHGKWISQDLQADIVPHVEAWRMFTSGQFLHRRVVATDLRDNVQLRPNLADASGAIAVWDILLYLVEVAELAARSTTSLNVDSITINVALENIAGRELISGDWNREIYGPYLSSANRFTARAELAATTVIAAPRAVGVELAQQLLRQFGLSISNKILDEWQNQVLDSSSR